MAELVKNNGEILYLYDAKMCNPNGDPDDENRPRMDYERERNLVSDVRLKRYIRDYLQDKFKDKEQQIYITKAEGVVNATERLKAVLGKNRVGQEDVPALLKKLIDVRLFGATMPIKADGGGAGSSLTFIGPVQFNWGYSLNRTALVDSSSITSQFASESGKEQGTIGKDYRVYYSLIAFHGIISARRAEKTGLTEADIALLDEALLKAIPLLATRSKIGQYPRLYLRLEYQDADTFCGDLREYLSLEEATGLREISDVKLRLEGMADCLKSIAPRVARAYCWQHEHLCTLFQGQEVRFPLWLEGVIGKGKVQVLQA
ncbi:MAG: type I-B CRISPR-associated protein Cas7/Csh2 [Moorellaceae bacterium]